MTEVPVNVWQIAASALVGVAAVLAAFLKYRRDGETLKLKKDLADKQAELDRAKVLVATAEAEAHRLQALAQQDAADTQAHAQALSGLSALCTALREQLDAGEKVWAARVAALETRLVVEQTACQEAIRRLTERLGMEG